MKELLLTFCSLGLLTTMAEGKELKIQVQVTPSASKNFPINELQFQWVNLDVPDQLPALTWNAQNQCFEGTIELDSEYYREYIYKINLGKQLLILSDMKIEHTFVLSASREALKQLKSLLEKEIEKI